MILALKSIANNYYKQWIYKAEKLMLLLIQNEGFIHYREVGGST